MNNQKTTKSNTTAGTNKTPNTRSGPNIKTNTPCRNFNFSANRSTNDKSSGKCSNVRSKSNLTGNDNRNTDGLKSNVLLKYYICII